MARPSELKQYKGLDVIYGLYTDAEGIRYIGYSKDVHRRFLNHISNNDNETNIYKRNWIDKNKGLIKIEILSVNPLDWEAEEKHFIKKYNGQLVNVCKGGKNNIQKIPFELLTDRDHVIQINQSLTYLNKYLKSKNRPKRFELLKVE